MKHNSKPPIIGLLLCLFLVTSLAVAKGSTAKDSVRYTVRTPHSRIEAGAARIKIKASSDAVLDLVMDFAGYSKFIDRFEKVRVLSRAAGQVDVYLQVPILKGAAKIWAVVRFLPVRETNGEKIVEGHMVRGNVERLDAIWRIRRIGDNLSQLHLEMLIIPKLPVPGSLVTGEVAYAADAAVSDLRAQAERK